MSVSLGDFEEIQNLLDVYRFVSVKYFANHLGYPIVRARDVMNQFMSSNEASFSASYLLSGVKIAQPNKSFTIVTQDRLTEGKSQFLPETLSVSLYGLQLGNKLTNSDKENVAKQFYFQDINQTNELLLKQLQSNSAQQSDSATIRCKGLTIVAAGVKQRSLLASTTAFRDVGNVGRPASRGPSPSPSPTPALFATSASSSTATAGNPGIAAASSSSSSAPSSTKVNPKTAAIVTSFFSKPAAIKSESIKPIATANNSKSIIKQVKSEPVSANTSLNGTTTTSASVESTEDASQSESKVDNISEEEAEWDDGTGHSLKVDKTRITKQREVEEGLLGRKRATRDEEEEEDADDDKANKDGAADATGDAQNAVSYGKFQKHGAMDNYLEDVAIAKEKQRQLEGRPEEDSTEKKKRRKLVEKMMLDEKGYLITQMEWVDCSDNEAETSPASAVQPTQQHQQQKSIVKTNSLPVPAAKKTAPLSAAAKKAQSSSSIESQKKGMMAFLGKK